MRKRVNIVFWSALVAAPLAQAQPAESPGGIRVTTSPAGEAAVWLPGVAAPRDMDGNSAVANRPRPGDTDRRPDVGGVRGLPSWAPFGPSGADAESIAAVPNAPGVVLAGIASAVGGGGLYRSADGGQSWSITSGTGNRAVNAVAFTGGGTGWAATDNGLFRSDDAGLTWTEVFLPISGQALVKGVSVSQSTIMVGLGQFLGGTATNLVFASTDGGATWNDVSPPLSGSLGASVVALDPSNPQRAFAAFTGDFGFGNDLWVTTDGGAAWLERSAGLPDYIINDVAIAGGTVFIAGGQDFGSQFLGVYSTGDNGETWNELSADWSSRSARAVAVDPAAPDHIIAGTTRGGVFRSVDGGATWTSSGGVGTYQVNDVEFVPGAPQTIYLGMGSVAVFRSTDGGGSFSPSSNGISQLELTSFAVNPLNTSEIAASYVGLNDGGVFITTDAGATWTLSQAPLPRWQKVYFAPDGTLYGSHDGPLGRADDGLWRRNANGSWSNLGPGLPGSLDNIGVDIAASNGPNPVVLWSGYRWGNGWGAQVWSYGRSAPGVWEREFEGVHASEYAHSVLWLNGGAGPDALSSIIYYGQEGGAGGVLRSTDMADTWAPSEAGYFAGWNGWKLAHGSGPGDVYLAATASPGSNDGAIFRSTDGGLSWNWQGAIPASRVLAADPATPGTLFIHPTWLPTGPQRSTDHGVSFQPFDTGFLGGVLSRDLIYGGVVSGARRLYSAATSGGFATDLAGGGPACPPDWNDDGDVNSGDISAFLTSWLASVQGGTLEADFNGDNAVNSGDISAFLTAWLDAVQNGC